MCRLLCSLTILCLLPLAHAGDQLFEMTDPRGDDLGAGTLTYPVGFEWQNGDLDLLSFAAEKAKDGVWFEVRLRNRVRSPDGLTVKTAAEPIRNFVKYDFFNINVDVYIDTDNQPGSGNVSTIPGRQVELHRDTAWEKAVIVTPRPFPAKSILKKFMENKREAQIQAEQGRISQGDNKRIASEVEELIEDRFFFATRMRVSSRKIYFFVPDSFLGGEPQAHWRYAVVITAADIEQRVELSFLDQGKTALMMVPVAQASAIHSWGVEFGSDTNQPPIADVLLPTVAMQQSMLHSYDSVSGQLATIRGFSVEEFQAYQRTEKNQEKLASTKATATKQPKKAETAVKHSPKAHASETQAQAKPEKTKVKAAGAETPVAQPKPEVATAPQPETNVDDLLTRSKSETGSVEDRPIAQRLRELETLKEQGLISQEEYDKLRKRILSDL